MQKVNLKNFHRPNILKTKDIRTPNYYTQALDGEFKEYAFNEERAYDFKGQWRSRVFCIDDKAPLDLELGTGNGVHFQHYCLAHPQRCLLGIEIKYKPLIQTIRGALRLGARNGRVVRFHAFNVDLLLGHSEVNDVFIHFPDPWTTPRKPQNRLLNLRMLDLLWDIQKSGAKLDFKTDSREMFLWALEEIKQSKYQIEYQTLDLHKSPMAAENVVTGFEKIFLSQGIEINFVRLRKA